MPGDILFTLRHQTPAVQRKPPRTALSSWSFSSLHPILTMCVFLSDPSVVLAMYVLQSFCSYIFLWLDKEKGWSCAFVLVVEGHVCAGLHFQMSISCGWTFTPPQFLSYWPWCYENSYACLLVQVCASLGQLSTLVWEKLQACEVSNYVLWSSAS